MLAVIQNLLISELNEAVYQKKKSCIKYDTQVLIAQVKKKKSWSDKAVAVYRVTFDGWSRSDWISLCLYAGNYFVVSCLGHHRIKTNTEIHLEIV